MCNNLDVDHHCKITTASEPTICLSKEASPRHKHARETHEVKQSRTRQQTEESIDTAAPLHSRQVAELNNNKQ